jgi:hypothetical protein
MTEIPERRPGRRPRTDAFGDFQTPPELARLVCERLADRCPPLAPASLLEPTCGIGRLLLAAMDQFPLASTALGIELNPGHVETLTASIAKRTDASRARIVRANIFHDQAASLIESLPEPILAIGNPPWVNNSALGALGSDNRPTRFNSARLALSGLDALTGKSNFDLAEWILLRLLDLLQGRQATFAMLCKTAVARKVLAYCGRNRQLLHHAEIHPIDAPRAFGAAVHACLFVASTSRSEQETIRTLPVAADDSLSCRIFPRLGEADGKAAAKAEGGGQNEARLHATRVIGYQDGQIIANLEAYQRWRHLRFVDGKRSAATDKDHGNGRGRKPNAHQNPIVRTATSPRWRSGIKHDCVDVMEFVSRGGRLLNGLGEEVFLEDECLFPLRKGSALRSGFDPGPGRWMLVPHRSLREDPGQIRERAPRTWAYLERHGETLDRRASAIYRKRPRFSVFGVGDYAFSPWKVVVSGFSKQLRFIAIGPCPETGKPVVLDDTAYFLPCATAAEAHSRVASLHSAPALEFFSAFLFPDAKRPVTIDLLRRIDLDALDREPGLLLDPSTAPVR